VSVATCPHYCTDSDVTWANGRVPPSCAPSGRFAIGARVSLLRQHSAAHIGNRCMTAQRTHTHTRPFYGPFSGTTRVSRCQKKSSSGLYSAREDNRGRHTDHPAGRHSIRTNQHSPPSSPPFFTGRMPFLPPNQKCQSTEGKYDSIAVNVKCQ